MKITVFGAGYVGLVTGACLADVGHQVLCLDVDEARVAALGKGIIPIYEPGLEALVKSNLSQGRLRFSADAAEGVVFGELLFIAVGTPPDEDGSADLSHVFKVAETIGRHLQDYRVVINKSTVPVGTADLVQAAISAALNARSLPIPFAVASNPEFLKEGSAIEDFAKGARIVVGTDSEQVRELMRECYAPYNRNHDKLMFMDVRSAEMTKYAANAMLATKISFMNELANLAELLGADIEQVRQGIGSDPRIGYHFIYPGCGYGGSCFPKDMRALVTTASQAGYDPELLKAVETVNHRQKNRLFHKLNQAFSGDLKNRTIAVWGLAFKPNTDDLRGAPSRVLMESLWEAGAKVQAFDPVAMPETARIYGDHPGLQLVETMEQAVEDADALAICTEWKQFRTVDFLWLKEKLKSPVLVDGRNLYDPAEIKKAGLQYFAMGRGASLEMKGERLRKRKEERENLHFESCNLQLVSVNLNLES